jgi:hypothetical protein
MTVSTATGGTTVTLVDSKQAGVHSDGDWVNGGLFIIQDAGLAGAAPEDEVQLITSYTDSTGTFGFSAMTAAPAAGDLYGFVGDYYPLYTMQELANEALQNLGDIPLINTSITTAAGQTEYDIPVAVKRSPPYRVQIQGRTGDSNDNQWVDVSGWEYRPSTRNAAATLVLPSLPVGRTIALWYMGEHPSLSVFTGSTAAINETLDPELVTRTLVELALEWQNARMQGTDSYLLQVEMKAQQRRMEYEAKRRQWKPARRSKLLVLGNYREEDEDEILAPPPA